MANALTSIQPHRRMNAAGMLTPDRTDPSGRTADRKDAELRQAAQDFEAIFVRQLFKTMRSTIPGDGMFGKGAAGDIYGGLMDTAIGDLMAERSTLGLADTIYRQLVQSIDTSHDEGRGNSGIDTKPVKDNTGNGR